MGAYGTASSLPNSISGATGPKFAVINASASGNTELVAAVAGKKIRVYAVTYIADGDVIVEFRTGTTTPIWDNQDITTNSGASPAFTLGIFETVAGDALNINLDGNIAVGGGLTYGEV